MTKNKVQTYTIDKNIGVMLNVRDNSGKKLNQKLAKEALANAFDIARIAMNKELDDRYFHSQAEMNSKFIEFLNIGLSYQFMMPSIVVNERSLKGNIKSSEFSLKWYPVINYFN